jgi:hypothetical protein
MSQETTTTGGVLTIPTATKTGKRGRPTVDGSARQARLAKREERAANGYAIKRGRPKKAAYVQMEIPFEDEA